MRAALFLYRLAGRNKAPRCRERGHPCPPKRARARLAVKLHPSTVRFKVSLPSRCALMAGRDARAPSAEPPYSIAQVGITFPLLPSSVLPVVRGLRGDAHVV